MKNNEFYKFDQELFRLMKAQESYKKLLNELDRILFKNDINIMCLKSVCLENLKDSIESISTIDPSYLKFKKYIFYIFAKKDLLSAIKVVKEHTNKRLEKNINNQEALKKEALDSGHTNFPEIIKQNEEAFKNKKQVEIKKGLEDNYY
jgi:hypothetical protein